jgi:hypothetical protein
MGNDKRREKGLQLNLLFDCYISEFSRRAALMFMAVD